MHVFRAKVLVVSVLLIAISSNAQPQLKTGLQTPSDGKYEPQCQSENDYGWPRFHSEAELRESPWAFYFASVYGELPKAYPFCIYDLWALDRAAYLKANITGHPVVLPSELKEGDLFEGGLTQYQIYHGSWEPLPANAWFEFTHMAFPTETEGFWVWRQRGSGIWYNTGNTIVFPQPADMSQTLRAALEFMTKICSF
jgi:hypothetical protein